MPRAKRRRPPCRRHYRGRNRPSKRRELRIGWKTCRPLARDEPSPFVLRRVSPKAWSWLSYLRASLGWDCPPMMQVVMKMRYCILCGCHAPLRWVSYRLRRRIIPRETVITLLVFGGDERHPLERVSWHEAVLLCYTLSQLCGLANVYDMGRGEEPMLHWGEASHGFRRPTEVGWEYAGRAGSLLRFSGSDDVAEVAWYDEDGDCTTQPVGRKKANAWGLYDLFGNVWEWCLDWERPYAGPAADPLGLPLASSRCAAAAPISATRMDSVASRSRNTPDYRRFDVGFRGVRACVRACALRTCVRSYAVAPAR